MNKIYKVIWNRVKNCYVVVSEIAKREGKSGAVQGGTFLRAMIISSLCMGALFCCRRSLSERILWDHYKIPIGINMLGMNGRGLTKIMRNLQERLVPEGPVQAARMFV